MSTSPDAEAGLCVVPVDYLLSVGFKTVRTHAPFAERPANIILHLQASQQAKAHLQADLAGPRREVGRQTDIRVRDDAAYGELRVTAWRLTDADLQLESEHVNHARTKGAPMPRTVRFLALVSACFCMASLALTACGSATSPSQTTSASAAAGLTGYDWHVVAIRHDGKVTSIPARLDIDLRFSRNRRFLANDPVNTHSGTFRVTPGGFATSVLGVTAVGYAGHDPVILLSQAAISAFDNGAQAAVKVTGNQLVVSVASYTLTCLRHGPAGSTGERPAVPAPASMTVCAHANDVDRLTIGRVNLLPQNHEQFTFPAQITVASPHRSQAVARALCALPRFPSGPILMSCPVDLAISYVLNFTAGARKLAPVTVDASGCQLVRGLSPARWTARSPAFWSVLATAAGIAPADLATFRGTIAS